MAHRMIRATGAELEQTGADWSKATVFRHFREHQANEALTGNELEQTGAKAVAEIAENRVFLRVSACSSCLFELEQNWSRLEQRRAGGFAPVTSPLQGEGNWAPKRRRPDPKLNWSGDDWRMAA